MRTHAELEAVFKTDPPARTPTSAPASPKPLRILLVASAKDHGPSEHDYPLWQQRWTTLLRLADGVTVVNATDWPTPEQWAGCDVAVFYSSNSTWSAGKAKDLDAFQSRGGGLVFLHMAVNAPKDPDALAGRIGLAWQPNLSKFRHGPLDLSFADASHPITRNFPASLHLIDESYWNLAGDVKHIHVLGSGKEENESRPLIWTYEHSHGRVFVCIPGHYTWTFDDPLYRLLVLRGISWAADPANSDRLSPLCTLGARLR